MSSKEIIGWELLHELIRNDFKEKEDILLAIAHCFLINQKGCLFLSVGTEKTLRKNENKIGTEKLPVEWNKKLDGDTYALRYIINKKNVIVLEAHILDGRLWLNFEGNANATVINIENVFEPTEGNLSTQKPIMADVLDLMKRGLLKSYNEIIGREPNKLTKIRNNLWKKKPVIQMIGWELLYELVKPCTKFDILMAIIHCFMLNQRHFQFFGIGSDLEMHPIEGNNVIENLPTDWTNSQNCSLKYMLNGEEIFVLSGFRNNDNLKLMSQTKQQALAMVIDLAKTVKSTETGDLLSLVPDVTNFLDNFKQTLLDVYIKDYNGTSSGNGINEYGMVSTGSSNSFASDHGVHKADFVSSANSSGLST